MVDDHSISIRIEPIGKRGKNVGFDAFIAELQAVHATLVRADRLASHGDVTTDYEVVNLSLNSPANVVIQPKARDRKRDTRSIAVGGWMDGLQQIRQGTPPPAFDRPMLEKVRELAAGVRKNRVRTTLSYQSKSVEINHIFERRIVDILSHVERMFGSVEGRLEALNIHNRQNVFHIYPIAGAKKVMCHFQDVDKPKVMGAVDKYVIVTGMAEYQFKDAFPYKMEVRNIDVLQSEPPWPTLEELRGIAPSATGDEESAEFVHRIRHGWR